MYQELTDTSYVFPGTYDEGVNLKSSFSMSLQPKTDIFFGSLYLGFDRSFWGSDFNYEKFTMIARIWPTRYWPIPLEPRMRFFFGHSSIAPPRQEMYNLAGAGALDKENFFWLRSVGAFWKDYYNNYHVPGSGNLRGYFDGDFSFKRIFSSNIEMKLPFPLPPTGRTLSRKLRGRQLYLFYDWGKVLDKRPMELVPAGLRGSIGEDTFDEIIQDFGIGLRLWKVTAEFPIYLSHPALSGEEERWDFRWTLGLEGLF